ncbi:nucleoside-diphosphate-sugar epimerase [Niabella ginsenosidivorans]|uniref:Nucleoside-diphosphate-sugar epimerase n=1 Tax=Niabella ginsenosidivorans TaxID=1176587 RepID=A0A1A9I0S1_9BACT|nr:NAD-dependent epimerase/dehydratase family protein [Niabella ginsenosidivorans]ANH80925.1 nucleoside-diphosphate-sugar epimerase [Niabella ginsenosidivorans]
MTIIITGASGFVGNNLVQSLQRSGKAVKPVSLRNVDWKNQIPKDGDAIIHLAGKAHDTTNRSHKEEEYFHVNRDLTIRIFKQFLDSNITDFFFFSSVKAVADTVDQSLSEENIPSPLTPYGKSKLAAENYLTAQNLPKDKRLFILRPCMIHGPGNKGNLNLLYKLAKKGVPWPLAAFENKRSFLSIDNLCYLVIQMLNNPEIRSGIYNLADDIPLSTNELITLIAKLEDKRPRLWAIPPGLINGLAKIGDTLRFMPLNSERLKKLTESYVVSNQKIKKELNIERLPVSSVEGLQKTIKSFQNK